MVSTGGHRFCHGHHHWWTAAIECITLGLCGDPEKLDENTASEEKVMGKHHKIQASQFQFVSRSLQCRYVKNYRWHSGHMKHQDAFTVVSLVLDQKHP